MGKHTIYLIRHGQTEANALGQHAGRYDVPLDSTGIAQAKKLEPFFKGMEIDYIGSSPLQRCQQTCSFAGLATKQKPDLIPDLMEWDYGEYEKKTLKEIYKQEPGWNVLLHGARGGESVSAVEERARRLITLLSEKRGTSVLFSHGHFSRVLSMLWIALPVNAGRFFAFFNAHISVLRLHEGNREILRWNSPPGS